MLKEILQGGPKLKAKEQCVCAVFDSAIGAYGRPIFSPSRGAVVRSFSDEVNRAAADNQLYSHPEDFELRLLAFFDEETGIFRYEGVETLARGKDVRHDDAQKPLR